MNIEQVMQKLDLRTRWMIILIGFAVIAVLDFTTPSEYILAYLYTIPILISLSFLKPQVSKILILVAMAATLLNLFIPRLDLDVPFVVINRALAALSILISSIFMLRYLRHQEQVSEQEKLLATERQLSKMRDDFIATLTHDLKTPMLGEQRALQYLIEDNFDPINPEQKDVLEALERNKKRQLELVNNLLSVYRYDNLGVQLVMERVDMDELIADVITEVQYLANERNLKLEYHCSRTPPKIKGDAIQLKRVLANLLHNALNYTPAHGTIRVGVSEQGSNLLVEVADSGPGLAEGDLENIFHRFYRAEGTRDTVGTGLGLYLSRQLIQAHRGRIWAENMTGGGCCFRFTLPVEGESA